MTGHPAVSSQPMLAPHVVLDVAKAAPLILERELEIDASEREQHQHRRPEEPHHDDCGNGVDEHAPTEAERRSPTNGLIWQP